jgi:hypothetical protein
MRKVWQILYFSSRKEASMLRKNQSPDARPREGELYKVIKLHGAAFEIRYGYYEEIDRTGEPTEIYPDFIENPTYTVDGSPFVTLMQDACPHHYSCRTATEPDCGSCQYLERGEDLIGICRCPHNQRANESL